MDVPYSKAIRIISIVQLCLVFTLILWLMGYPFMGQLFSTKSKKELVLTVLGEGEGERMERNQERFTQLPLHQQMTVQRHLDELNKTLKHSFVKKVIRSIHILAFEISPIEQMWIVFSLLVPLLFLMNFEMAKQVAWFLPLIALCFSLDNHWNGYRELSQEARLFPTEEHIVRQYLQKPLSRLINEQQAELSLGWQRYLIDQWAKEAPSENPQELGMQVETGEYRFQVERILAQATQAPQFEAYTFKRQQSFPILLLYVSWNLFFAWFVNRNKRQIFIPASS